MRFLRRAALLLPLLALGCGDPFLSAYVEIPKFGLYLPAEDVVGAPAGGSISEDFEIDIGEQLDLYQPGATIDLRLIELSFAVVSEPPPDLSNVASLSLYSIPTDGGDPVLLASYERDPENPNPSSLRVKGTSNADLLPMIESGLIHLRADIATDGPTDAFTADIEAVFSLKVRLDYLEALEGSAT